MNDIATKGKEIPKFNGTSYLFTLVKMSSGTYEAGCFGYFSSFTYNVTLKSNISPLYQLQVAVTTCDSTRGCVYVLAGR